MSVHETGGLVGENDMDDEGEPRLLPATAVFILILLPFLLPTHLHNDARWVLAAAEVVLLVAIGIADPGRIDKTGAIIRALSIALVTLLLIAVGAVTVQLVYELVHGAPEYQQAGPLLVTGLLVWLQLSLTFALLYWEEDGGGPAYRLHRSHPYPDLAFVQHLNPELADPRWRPLFLDYAYLALTNSIAFSPTDVMPLTHRAKIAMGLHELTSFAILGLVIANAVNLLH